MLCSPSGIRYEQRAVQRREAHTSQTPTDRSALLMKGIGRMMLSLATVILLTASTLADHVDDYHKFEHPIKCVAVIGAGPAGLQAAATLKEHNFTAVRLFERQEKPGGTWYYQESTPVREPYP